MKEALVKPLTGEDDPALIQLIQFYDETLGFCPNSIKTMHRRPEIAYAFITLNKAVMKCKGKVSPSLKRLIGYISSATSGCRYCEAHTIRAAERYGAEADKLQNIWSYATHPSFTDAERAVLDLAFAASSIPNGVNDELASRVRKFWNEGEIVEIMGVIALFGFLNRWNDSMGTEMEQGAIDSGRKLLSNTGWEVGKHQYTHP